MTYPRELSTEKATVLEPVTQQLTEMEPGDESVITLNAQRTYWLYTWLHSQGIKYLFRVTRLTSNIVRITRLDTRPVEIVSSRDNPLNRLDELFLTHLATFNTLKETRDKVAELLREGLIEGEEVISLIQLWKEQNPGKEEENADANSH